MRAHTSTLRLFVSVAAFGVAATSCALGASQITFAEAPSFTTDKHFAFTRSPDKAAISVLLDGAQAVMETSSAPIVAGVWSMAIPIANADKGGKAEFHFRGFADFEEGASAFAVFVVNGQTSTAKFTVKHENWLHAMPVSIAPGDADVRLSMFMVVERDGKHPGARAMLSVDSIDCCGDTPNPYVAQKQHKGLQ